MFWRRTVTTDSLCKRRAIDGGNVTFLSLGFDHRGSYGMRAIMPKRITIRRPLKFLQTEDDRSIRVKLIPTKWSKRGKHGFVGKSVKDLEQEIFTAFSVIETSFESPKRGLSFSLIPGVSIFVVPKLNILFESFLLLDVLNSCEFVFINVVNPALIGSNMLSLSPHEFGS